MDAITLALENETVKAAMAAGDKFTVTVSKLLTLDEALAAMAAITGDETDEDEYHSANAAE